jgi:hypothetical protein
LVNGCEAFQSRLGLRKLARPERGIENLRKRFDDRRVQQGSAVMDRHRGHGDASGIRKRRNPATPPR